MIRKIKDNQFIYIIYYWLCVNIPRRISLEIRKLFNLGNKKRNYDKIKQYKNNKE